MHLTFLQHIQHNWPFAFSAVAQTIYLIVVVASGVMYTNQGPILRARTPASYWGWVGGLSVLLVVTWVVLIGSYLIDPTH